MYGCRSELQGVMVECVCGWQIPPGRRIGLPRSSEDAVGIEQICRDGGSQVFGITGPDLDILGRCGRNWMCMLEDKAVIYRP